MSVIAIIPARGGSKRLPNKNLETIDGQSLTCRAIKMAFDCEIFNDVILSTDAAEIAHHAKSNFNNLTIFKRPSHLAQDNSPMLPVVRHAVEEYSKTLKVTPDDVVLLQPTSPFRTVDDILDAYALFKRHGADAVVSVTKPEDDLVFRIGHARRMRPELGVVVPNGAIYVLWVGAMMVGHDWYSGCTYAYEMPKDRSLDIDTSIDLVVARAMAAHNAAS